MCRRGRRDTVSQVARRLSDQDIMRRYRMPVRSMIIRICRGRLDRDDLIFLRGDRDDTRPVQESVTDQSQKVHCDLFDRVLSNYCVVPRITTKMDV